jgi:Protein of unknown function (DUF2934)
MIDPNTISVEAITDPEQRQREIAHQLWEDEGRLEGKAEEHWDRAGLIIMDIDAKSEKLPNWLQKVETLAETDSTTDSLATEQDVTIAIQDLRKRMAGRSAA